MEDVHQEYTAHPWGRLIQRSGPGASACGALNTTVIMFASKRDNRPGNYKMRHHGSGLAIYPGIGHMLVPCFPVDLH